LFVTPVIRKLRGVFSQAQIDILTSPQGKIVVENNPHLNNVFVYKKFHKIERWFKRRRLSRRISSHRYDLCIVFESNLEYTKFAYKICKSALRIGIKSKFSDVFLHKAREFSYRRHALENYLGVLSELLGINICENDYGMDFFISKTEDSSQTYSNDFFIVHSSCSSYLPYKGWEMGNFLEISNYLVNQGFDVFITGQVNDKEPKFLLEKLRNNKRIHSFVGRSLDEVASLIKRSKGVLCLDTGLLHISRALNKPVVCLFGPSDPQHTGPLGKGIYRVIRKDFSCGPCQYFADYKRGEKERCLDGKVTPCMKAIEASEVIGVLRELIDGTQRN
jgi:ADP-heptose:LPS heptosyltransferase